jgi:hypothetical protein
VSRFEQQDEEFDRFGRQGWELVSFNTIGEKQVNPLFVGAKEYILTFKRQVGSGLKSCEESRKDALSLRREGQRQ